MRRTFYIENMGCQMNKLDAELVTGRLLQRGFEQTDDPDAAEVVIFNTCSVRQHAEDKVISKLGQLRRRCAAEPAPVLAVIGCMAQRLGRQLLDEQGHVDIVCAPGQVHNLPAMIEQAQTHKQRFLRLNDAAELEALEAFDTQRVRPENAAGFTAYVRVQRGCDNFCSYCIVPYVRGREQSRPLPDIVEECRRLADNGVIEITLLGQTVNSYRWPDGARRRGLADVLEAVHEINGLQRIRFVTNYPRNFDEDILRAMAALPKVCEYLHIPAQSGSDRILRAMNRHYTAAEYVDLMDRARELAPHVTLAGDFIVGFCGETEEDFAATKDLVRRVRYKNCFVFKYSPRPSTRADERMPDDVPEEVKKRRNHELLTLQNEISAQDNQRFVGQEVEILVEGLSKKPHLNLRDETDGDTTTANEPETPVTPHKTASEQPQLVGRTRGDHIVVFNGPPTLVGTLAQVRIQRAAALTLFGALTD